MRSLRQQHRMRPEIAEPVKCLSYPTLQNGPGTEGRAPLLGIDSSFSAHGSAFLLAHQWPEEQERRSAAAEPSASATASMVNEQEARLVVAVVQWLLKQGYSLADIAVLTPYLGQKRLLCRLMRTARVAQLGEHAPEASPPVRIHSAAVTRRLCSVMPCMLKSTSTTCPHAYSTCTYLSSVIPCI